jgi:hypothetical protein
MIYTENHRSTGLRRQELRDLHVRGIYPRGMMAMSLSMLRMAKVGGPEKCQALPGHNEDVWTMREGRADDAKVFERMPRHLDVHSVRREFAQALYQYYAGGRDLPPPSGRLRPKDYDRAAAERVTWALGHNRIDVVLRHYIR